MTTSREQQPGLASAARLAAIWPGSGGQTYHDRRSGRRGGEQAGKRQGIGTSWPTHGAEHEHKPA